MRQYTLLGLCLFLFVGGAASSDIPFVFDENSSNLNGYHLGQLENISNASPDLVGVPPISDLNDSEILIFPVDSSSEGNKSYRTVGEIKEEFDYKFWQKKGQILFSQGRYDESLSAFDQSVKENPKSAEGWNDMGFVLMNMHRYDEAIGCFDVAVALDPSLSDAWNSKADALYSLGRYDESLRACDAALRQDPMLAKAWFTRALILKKQAREAFIIARELL
ncbi:MAG: tetratricopeptide repeat protein [Methanothrix sp.]|nr:tetratricopeptide repeat protein [Methanothrix sp.]